MPLGYAEWSTFGFMVLAFIVSGSIFGCMVNISIGKKFYNLGGIVGGIIVGLLMMLL
jgi:hypothetical protein